MHDLKIGNSDRYQERVTQLAESYFVLMLEAFRSPSDGMFGTPSVIRALLHRASSEEYIQASPPHTVQLVEAVFEQFEVRLWSLMTGAFSGMTLPEKGACDLFVPIFGMLLKDRIRLIEYDNVPALKESVKHAFSTIQPSEIHGCIVGFCQSMLKMIQSKPPESVRRVSEDLSAFISSLQPLVPDPVVEELDVIRLELGEQEEQAPVRSRAFALN
ncbi:hypothetical protein [Rhizobium sp. MHM7A]|uniref:hypothetical protein n=1 Tax=Rhizobium sp. MHM7A TaxID=2583233 RepID=UPI0011075BF7|nr:hypothetical protein [Rhizobium sp. MHM7A]TLX16757.1 hypothetical protein FFR93_05280 [Rhizobium sp. MHM7A]